MRISIVLDLLYIVGTAVFFALMVLYISACASLGARGEAASAEERHS